MQSANIQNRSIHAIAVRICGAIDGTIAELLLYELSKSTTETTWRERMTADSPWESHSVLNTPELVVVKVNANWIDCGILPMLIAERRNSGDFSSIDGRLKRDSRRINWRQL